MITVTATCQSGHVQAIEVRDGMSLDMAKAWAALMDGTSSFFVNSPRGDEKSQIGRCGICGEQIDCEVAEEPK